MYLRPFRYEVSSTPILTRASVRGGLPSESLASTREHIAPTVRQDMRISRWQASLLMDSAHQQHVSSNA